MQNTDLLVKQHYLSESAGDFDSFKKSVQQTTSAKDYPLASSVEQEALVYSSSTVLAANTSATAKQALMAEWIKVWADGPGVLMIRRALDHTVVDRASELFENIIQTQQAEGLGAGDHFATAGANDRIWNALEKHGKQDPENFIHYYANEAIALASEAWLGTGYQITAQVNRVNPGGAAQSAHRDYHLGFLAKDKITAYPLHVHLMSPALTLQGAIAHCDMPIETGPTLYLPYSQNFPEGYIAFNRDEYQDYFRQHRSQLELQKGDAVFFNPALMHAAGENKTRNRHRLANLLQVSSAFGRVMESIDYIGLVDSIYPLLKASKIDAELTEIQIQNAVCACTDGYPFPTSLDADLPNDGLAPKAQRQYVFDALLEATDPHLLNKTLQQQSARRNFR